MPRPLEKIATFKVGNSEVAVMSDIRALKRAVGMFGRVAVNRAQMRGMNKAAGTTKTFANKLLVKHYNIKHRSVSPHLALAPRATLHKPTVAIRGRSKRLSIYKHTKNKPKQTALGVKYNAGGGNYVHKHQFLATMPNNTIQIAVRSTKKQFRRSYTSKAGVRSNKQLAIRVMEYPSVADMIVNKDVAPHIFKKFSIDYPRNLKQQLNWEFDKQRGR